MLSFRKLVGSFSAPAVRLSNRLSFTCKAILGGLLVALLLTVAAGLELRTLSASIDAMKVERGAIAQLRVHFAFWRDVVRSRAACLVELSPSCGTLVPSNSVARTEAAFNVHSVGHSTRHLTAASRQLAQVGMQSPKESLFVAYTMLSRVVLERIEEDGRASGLFGNADIDVVAAVLTRDFPTLLDNVAKQLDVAAIRNDDLTAYATGAQLIVLDSMDRIRVGAARLQTLGVMDDEISARISTFLDRIRSFEEQGGGGFPVGAGKTGHPGGEDEVEEGFVLYGLLLDAADSYLDQRVRQQEFGRKVTFVLVALFGLALIYVVWGTVLSIRKALQALAIGSQAFCEGDLSRRIVAETNDEFHLVALNFNKIADQFNKLLLLQQAQAEKSQSELQVQVAERTAALVHANAELTTAIETLKKTQGELIQSEKMAALGGLVAGVAHEVNTPIGLAYTTATHLHEQMQEVTDKFRESRLSKADFTRFLALADESLQHATASLKKAVALIDGFKQVAVDQTSDARRVFGLAKYLDEIIRSMSSALRKGRHRVEIQVPAEIELDSYPGALSQVVTNIVLNAVIHGFDERQGGTIRMAAEMEDPAHCRLTISDDGKGMSGEVLRRVFEPFFTTRRGRGGSGLGLHITFNLVTQKLGGRIKCDSAEGQGAVFTLLLPIKAS